MDIKKKRLIGLIISAVSFLLILAGSSESAQKLDIDDVIGVVAIALAVVSLFFIGWETFKHTLLLWKDLAVLFYKKCPFILINLLTGYIGFAIGLAAFFGNIIFPIVGAAITYVNVLKAEKETVSEE